MNLQQERTAVKMTQKTKQQKVMQKRTGISESGGITTREYNPMYVYLLVRKYFLKVITNAI